MNRPAAVLAGVTGLVGQHLLQELLTDDFYQKIYTISRRDPGINDHRLAKYFINFEELEDADIELKDTHIFCCLGTTMKKAGSKEAFKKVDRDYVTMLARKGAREGARQFLLVSSQGASVNSVFFYNRVKGEAEQAVAACGNPVVRIFRPSLILGKRSESRPRETIGKILVNTLSPLMAGRLRRYRGIHAAQIAKSMLRTSKFKDQGVFIYESDQMMEMAKKA